MTKKIILIAPDSFKGTLTSEQAGRVLARAARDAFPEFSVRQLVIADGGEGSLDAFYANSGGEIVTVEVCGPNFKAVKAKYLMAKQDKAVIELAQCAGLTLASPADPMQTTTFGVGELILNAAARGAREICLCLGGSATNDGGAGMAAALGTKFFDAAGNSFVPVGGTLGSVCSIDVSLLPLRLSGTKFTAMCDVTNPLCGASGAAQIFARQKGASEAEVLLLDANLAHFAERIKAQFDVDIADAEGSGAAGGMGAGARFFLGARLLRGIDVVLDMCGFDWLLDDAALVVTGEGGFDAQSLMGKAVGGIAARAKKRGVPVAVVAGRVEQMSGTLLREHGIIATAEASKGVQTISQLKKTCRQDLYLAAKRMLEGIEL